ncbi:MAG: hypothetical protein HC817_00295 [Saprospiraceae bacterium]|nr:hypothetical protein [Saprospiraceae bacterium]
MTKQRIAVLGSFLSIFCFTITAFGQAPTAPTAPRREFKNDGMAQDCALSSDGHWLMVAENRQVNVFHTRTALAVRRFEAHKHYVTAVATNPRKRIALSADRHGQIMMWNIDDLNLIMTYETPKDSVNLLRFAANGETFAATTQRENALYLFDILSVKPILKSKKFTSKVSDIYVDFIKNSVTTARLERSIQ